MIVRVKRGRAGACPGKERVMDSKALVEEFYDELEHKCTEAVELGPNGPVVAINIPIGQWHTVRALESGTVILECKDGGYEPLGEGDILE